MNETSACKETIMDNTILSLFEKRLRDLPEYRKHGAGKKIVMFLIEQARAENVGKIYLESTDGAKQFYRELGFSDLQGFMKV